MITSNKEKAMSKSTQWIGLAVTAIWIVLWIAAPAAAQSPKACSEDIARFCQGVPQGEGRIAQCLKAHESELSPNCKADMEQRQSKMKMMRQACSDDIKKFCGQIQPGGGRIVKCLEENRQMLSPACSESLPAGGRQAR
jgi:hypothetical protein